MPKPKKSILFLNENALPAVFTRGTISGKELRLRSAIASIDEVHVVTGRGSYVASHHTHQTPLEEKVIIHLLPPWPYYLTPLPLFLVGWYWAKKIHPLTIEAESPHLSGPVAVILGKLTHTPSLVEVRTTLEEMLKHRLKPIPLPVKNYVLATIQTWTLRHATAIIVNSNTYYHRLLKDGRTATIINPGLQYVPPLSPPKPASSPIIIGYLGRLVPEKGVSLLLTAIRDISLAGRVPPFKVEIAGDGPERSVLTQLAAHFDILHLVTFLGQVDNFTVLKHWDMMVNPCLVNAPLEMANAEAAYMGVPVICFGNKDYPETVKPGQTGLRIAPKTSGSLAKAIRYLLTNPAVLTYMKNQSPRFALEKYAFDTQVIKLQSLYQKLHLI